MEADWSYLELLQENKMRMGVNDMGVSSLWHIGRSLHVFGAPPIRMIILGVVGR